MRRATRVRSSPSNELLFCGRSSAVVNKRVCNASCSRKADLDCAERYSCGTLQDTLLREAAVPKFLAFLTVPQRGAAALSFVSTVLRGGGSADVRALFIDENVFS